MTITISTKHFSTDYTSDICWLPFNAMAFRHLSVKTQAVLYHYKSNLLSHLEIMTDCQFMRMLRASADIIAFVFNFVLTGSISN